MKKLITLFTSFALAFLFFACSNDDDTGTPNPDGDTIADFVASNPDYSSLAAAIQVAGLTATLDGQTDYTVFAPNNAAFSTFLSDNGFANLNDVPVDLLTKILLNHVVTGVNTSSDFTTGYITSLSVGDSTYL